MEFPLLFDLPTHAFCFPTADVALEIKDLKHTPREGMGGGGRDRFFFPSRFFSPFYRTPPSSVYVAPKSSVKNRGPTPSFSFTARLCSLDPSVSLYKRMLVYQHTLSSRFDAIRRVDVVLYFTFDRNVRSNEPHTTMYRIVVDDGRLGDESETTNNHRTNIERILTFIT